MDLGRVLPNGLQAPVSGDRDPIAFGHNRHPSDVDGSERNLWQIGMTDENDIVPGARKQLAETKGALIHKPSKHHLPGYLSGGPRQAQLEAQYLLHLNDREIEQVGDRLSGLTGSELLGNHLSRHRPHHRTPALMQRIERDQPPESHRTSDEYEDSFTDGSADANCDSFAQPEVTPQLRH